jgi:hypothetical protein
MICVFTRIHEKPDADLPGIAQAGDRESTILGFAQSRKQQGRQNGNDRDDDQQLDQGKTRFQRPRSNAASRKVQGLTWQIVSFKLFNPCGHFAFGNVSLGQVVSRSLGFGASISKLHP